MDGFALHLGQSECSLVAGFSEIPFRQEYGGLSSNDGFFGDAR